MDDLIILRTVESITNHPQYNATFLAYDFALLKLNLPVHHLSIKIYEDSLDNNHEHEDDHDSVVSLYGYVTGPSHSIEIGFYYL